MIGTCYLCRAPRVRLFVDSGADEDAEGATRRCLRCVHAAWLRLAGAGA